MNPISVPTTTRDLTLEFGKAIVRWSMAGKPPADTTLAVDRHTTSQLVDVVRGWYTVFQSELIAMQPILLRALMTAEQGGDARLIMADALRNDEGGLGTFLATSQPRYFAEVCQQGFQLQGDALKQFLEILLDFAYGPTD